jgi:GntR family transcriptional regulator
MEILSGAYRAGSLPSESELILMFGATRNAVREALDLLRRENLVERVPGAGTFVISAKAAHRQDRLLGLAEQLEDRSRVTVSVLHAGLMRAPKPAASRLGLEPGTQVVFLERRLFLDGTPLSLWSSYLPADRAAPLLTADLRRDFYDLAERYLGLELEGAEVITEAVAADQSMADLLQLQLGAPILHLERLTREKSGRPFEFGFVWLRGDRIQFVAQLHRGATEAGTGSVNSPEAV